MEIPKGKEVHIPCTPEEIKSQRQKVLKHFEDFKEGTALRRKKLEGSQKYLIFVAKVDELNGRLVEKLQTASDENYKDHTNLQRKIQRHMVFESEVEAERGDMELRTQDGEAMIQNKHDSSDRIQKRLDDIHRTWDLLIKKMKEKGQKLHESLQMQQFLRECHEVQIWLDDKEMFVKSDEFGKDLEHVEVLQKKFDEFRKDLMNHERMVDDVNETANVLLENQHPDEIIIKEKINEVNKTWDRLKDLTQDRQQKLYGAHEIQHYNRETDEAATWIDEKEVLLDTDDCGKDLTSVQALKRKHDGVERDLAAIEEKVQHLNDDGVRLMDTHPLQIKEIRAKQTDIVDKWNHLRDKADERKAGLDESLNLHLFLSDYRDLMSWIIDMKKVINAEELPRDVAGAEALVTRHREIKGEIDSREEAFVNITEGGQKLINENHYAAEQVKEKLAVLLSEKRILDELWRERSELYEQCRDLQVYNRDVDLAEAWMTKKEVFLASEDVGQSTDEVEVLIKKHADFEKSLAVQEEKLKVLGDEATRLIEDNHYASPEITDKWDKLIERRNVLYGMSDARSARLQDARLLHMFCRDCYENKIYINKQLKTASDEGYLDPTNLQSKIKKHNNFEAELKAHKGRIEKLIQDGEGLIENNHYAKDDIKEQEDDIYELWQQLIQQSQRKGVKLKEALEQQQFNRGIDEVITWLNEVEGQMSSDDYGKDLKSAQHLQKKHQVLEMDVVSRRDRIDNIPVAVNKFEEAGHFDIDQIKNKAEPVVLRYNALQDLMEIKRNRLCDAVKLHQLMRDAEEEEDWIKEKMPIVETTNTGRDLIDVQNLIKKHNELENELGGHENNVATILENGEEMVQKRHYASPQIKEKTDLLIEKFHTLKDKADQRNKNLEEAMKTQQYLAEANEAETWMAEKEPIVASTDYGKDEDAAEALLKKNEAVLSELEAYAPVIDGLRTQANSCKELDDPPNDNLYVAVFDFTQRKPGETTIKRGDVVKVTNKEHPDWWKVQWEGTSGFVPKDYLKKIDVKPKETKNKNNQEDEEISDKQEQIEEQYATLLDRANERQEKLTESCEAHQLIREARELTDWVNDKKAVLLNAARPSEDVEQVEVIQRKFDDYQKDLKANQNRLMELNALAEKLHAAGQPEAAQKIRDQIAEMNESWTLLQDLTDQRAEMLGSAHEVQLYHRSADETSEWIAEKDKALDLQDIGHDLAGVQRLQRKHEGLERELAALYDKVMELDETSERLVATHPDQAVSITEHQTQLNEQWNKLSRKADDRKTVLQDSVEFQKFLAGFRDLQAWNNSMLALVSSDEMAKDVTGAEALLDRHLEHKKEIEARTPALKAWGASGQDLLNNEHFASDEIQDRLKELTDTKNQLDRAWDIRQHNLEQNLQQQEFLKGCEQLESWIATREASLDPNKVKNESLEVQIKKHENFDRAVPKQEEKIMELQAAAEQLMMDNHYDKRGIAKKNNDLVKRWNNLKKAMDKDKAKLQEAQKLDNFAKDMEDMEQWIADRSKIAQDQSMNDPNKIQNQYKQHQAFEKDLIANNERLQNLLGTGNELLQGQNLSPQERAMVEKLKQLQDDWVALLDKAQDKGEKLKEATKGKMYDTAVKDFEYWLDDVEHMLESEDPNKDLAAVQNITKKHELVDADIKAHEDRLKELNEQAETCLAGDVWDKAGVRDKNRAINERYQNVKKLAKQRKKEIEDASDLHKFFQDVDNENAWINEKKLIVQSKDYGKDLDGVTTLCNKHKRLQQEMDTHENIHKNVQNGGNKQKKKSKAAAGDIDKELRQLDRNWRELNNMSADRKQKLNQSRAYQELVMDADEEAAWIAEKQQMMADGANAETLAALQNLMKKQDAFDTDFKVHKARVQDVVQKGNSLAKENSHHADDIKRLCRDLQDKLNALDRAAKQRRVALTENLAFHQFMWKADVVESWINDKEAVVKSEDFGKDLSAIKTQLTKQRTFDDGLETFENIKHITVLKDELVAAKHKQTPAVKNRYTDVMNRWIQLKRDSLARKKKLLALQEQYKQLDDLNLGFAKKASGLISWMDNIEEELMEPVKGLSHAEFKTVCETREKFKRSIKDMEAVYNELAAVDKEVEKYGATSNNPYTWLTMDNVKDSWRNLLQQLQDRQKELDTERLQQNENEQLRKQFAQTANAFHAWQLETRAALMDSRGTLQNQLDVVKRTIRDIQDKQVSVSQIQEMASALEARKVYDNRHTEHSSLGLGQQWEHLNQLGVRMQNNLEEQIKAFKTGGVTEAQLKEFKDMFKHYDTDQNGVLDHQEFKSCLRALGYDMPMVLKGERDTEFENILDMVDPNRDGVVSIQEYIAFMISRETVLVASGKEVKEAFERIAVGQRPYVTAQELKANLPPDEAAYCIKRMQPFVDRLTGRVIPDAYDYVEFVNRQFPS